MGLQIGIGYRVASDHDMGGFAAMVEQLGYHSVWVGEHVANWHRPMPTVIPALGAFAACTKRITIGSAVLLLPLRNPTLLAKELATLDLMSDGRLAVGVGLGGENPSEYAACGVPVHERGGRADEMLPLLRRLWREETVSHQGKYFSLQDVSIDPRPQPTGPPIYVAGRQDAALRRAARYGDGFLPYLFTPEQYAAAFSKVRSFAEQYGRALAGFQGALYQFIFVAETASEARHTAIEAMSIDYNQDFTKLADRFCVLGTPDQCIARLREYSDAGASHIVLAPATSDNQARDQIGLIAREVLPALV